MTAHQRRAALTGAATGIGAETATRLKAAGYHVTAFDITEPAGVDVWVPLDLADPKAIAKAAQTQGPFDCLINNAGLPPKPGAGRAVLAVNTLGLIQFTEGMLPNLEPGASIVNTASRAGAAWRENLDQVKALLALRHPDDLPAFLTDHQIDDTRAYELSKEAVIVWTMAQAQAMHEKGLRMNSVSPAAVSTGILDDFKTAFGDKVDRNLARVGRAGLASEVADVIVFLASPQSNWIKGQDIVVDGGMTAMAQSEALGL